MQKKREPFFRKQINYESTEIQLPHFILFRIKKKSSESVIKEKSLQEGIYKIRF